LPVEVFSALRKHQFRYRELEVLHECSLWRVTLRRKPIKGSLVVFKELKEKFSFDRQRRLLREIELLSKLNDHPAIVRLTGCSLVTTRTRNPALMLDYMANGDLTHFMHRPEWTPTAKIITLIGIASALAFLHHNDVILRDLKPSHVLFDASGGPRIAGLGKGKAVPFDAARLVNSLPNESFSVIYHAPDPEPSPAGDVYSFGAIAHLVLHGEELTPMRRAFESVAHAGVRGVLEKCLSQTPTDRPRSADIERRLRDSEFLRTVQGIDMARVSDYIEALPVARARSQSRLPRFPPLPGHREGAKSVEIRSPGVAFFHGRRPQSPQVVYFGPWQGTLAPLP
jgi:serine/threonine protein kinase